MITLLIVLGFVILGSMVLTQRHTIQEHEACIETLSSLYVETRAQYEGSVWELEHWHDELRRMGLLPHATEEKEILQ